MSVSTEPHWIRDQPERNPHWGSVYILSPWVLPENQKRAPLQTLYIRHVLQFYVVDVDDDVVVVIVYDTDVRYRR